MEEHVFKLFMERFDNIEAGIKSYHDRMDKHVETDLKVHAVVERHATYWKFLFMGLPVVGGALAAKMGWK